MNLRKCDCIEASGADYGIGADSSGLMNIEGYLRKHNMKARTLHIANLPAQSITAQAEAFRWERQKSYKGYGKAAGTGGRHAVLGSDPGSGAAHPFEPLEEIPEEKTGNTRLVTGPGRTADMEKVLIPGAYGPKRMVVFVYP